MNADLPFQPCDGPAQSPMFVSAATASNRDFGVVDLADVSFMDASRVIEANRVIERVSCNENCTVDRPSSHDGPTRRAAH
jgi:hypothetical protein